MLNKIVYYKYLFNFFLEIQALHFLTTLYPGHFLKDWKGRIREKPWKMNFRGKLHIQFLLSSYIKKCFKTFEIKYV